MHLRDASLPLQAALDATSQDPLTVAAAAMAHAKQDLAPAAPLPTQATAEPGSGTTRPCSAGATPKQLAQLTAGHPACAPTSQASAPKLVDTPPAKHHPAAGCGPHMPEGTLLADPLVSERPISPCPSGVPQAASDPLAPGGVAAPSAKKSAKKRKQANRDATNGPAKKQRKKKPHSSQGRAPGAAPDPSQPGEAHVRGSASTIDYSVAEPSNHPPEGSGGHDDEVVSPDKGPQQQPESQAANPDPNMHQPHASRREDNSPEPAPEAAPASADTHMPDVDAAPQNHVTQWHNGRQDADRGKPAETGKAVGLPCPEGQAVAQYQQLEQSPQHGQSPKQREQSPQPQAQSSQQPGQSPKQHEQSQRQQGQSPTQPAQGKGPDPAQQEKASAAEADCRPVPDTEVLSCTMCLKLQRCLLHLVQVIHLCFTRVGGAGLSGCLHFGSMGSQVVLLG